MIGATGACPDVAVGVAGWAATGVGESVLMLFSVLAVFSLYAGRLGTCPQDPTLDLPAVINRARLGDGCACVACAIMAHSRIAVGYPGKQLSQQFIR
jgi:hypothetical protein